jgi:hypothetical protein
MLLDSTESASSPSISFLCAGHLPTAQTGGRIARQRRKKHMSETTDHSVEVTVRFPPLRSYDEFEITGAFSSVGTNLFRLDDELAGCVGPIHFHDVIEATPTKNRARSSIGAG